LHVELQWEQEHLWLGRGSSAVVGLEAGGYLDGRSKQRAGGSRSDAEFGDREWTDVQLPVFGWERVRGDQCDVAGYRCDVELRELVQHLLRCGQRDDLFCE